MAAPTLSPEIRNIITATANRAASQTVKQTLLGIGVDVTSASAIQESQQDWHFVRRMRKASEAKPLALYLLLAGALFSIVNSLLVLGVRYFIEGM